MQAMPEVFLADGLGDDVGEKLPQHGVVVRAFAQGQHADEDGAVASGLTECGGAAVIDTRHGKIEEEDAVGPVGFTGFLQHAHGAG